jgi:hypothetical protein
VVKNNLWAEGRFPQREEAYARWLQGYRAPNPKHQKYCSEILREGTGSSSQYSQDLFIFFNIFKYWPMLNMTGFYVDSGANDAKELSNTYFYDVCLGWQGLCIEPETRYHAGIREHRSCVLVTECISDVEKTVSFSHSGVSSSISGISGNIPCSPLSKILMRHPMSAKSSQIDFWSLDVEGHELQVLDTVDFKSIHVKVLLIEDFWLPSRSLDRKLSESGYHKYHQLQIDSVFVNRSFSANTKIWYPKNYGKDWDSNNEFRKTVKSKLVC